MINAASLQKISGLDFAAPSDECEFLSAMDAQMDKGKGIFGGGIIMSDRLAAELKAAELKAAELKAAELKAAVEKIHWPLSARELATIEHLNAKQSRNGWQRTEAESHPGPLFA